MDQVQMTAARAAILLSVVCCVLAGVVILEGAACLALIARARDAEAAIAEARGNSSECRATLERTVGQLETYQELLGVAARRGGSAVGGR